MRELTPCVYILASAYHGTLYVGVTSNLVGRLVQHRAGAFEGFTKRHGVLRLVYFETGESMRGAIQREKTLKKWPRDWKCNLIERGNPEWNDLGPSLGLPPLTEPNHRPKP